MNPSTTIARPLAVAGLAAALAGCALGLAAPAADAAVKIEAPASAQETQPAGETAPASTERPVADVSQLSPVTAADLEDGAYSIEVDSSSSMFRIVDATLFVEDGAMTCVLTMSGQGYGFLFPGTGDEAAAAGEDDLVPFVLDGAGAKTFALPLESLNTEVPCAAWSIKKEAWYDRTLVFLADTLAPRTVLADGTYLVDLALEGGSGRAGVESPARLEVEGGAMTLTVTWSSPNYDMMVVGEQTYLPVNEGGNSRFEIPLRSVDKPLAVQAETTAMSTPHMIDYVLTPDASSVKEAQ